MSKVYTTAQSASTPMVGMRLASRGRDRGLLPQRWRPVATPSRFTRGRENPGFRFHLPARSAQFSPRASSFERRLTEKARSKADQ
jgi:hypothetical protein